MITKGKKEIDVETKIKCDICGKEYSLLDKDMDYEAQEFVRIRITAGYGSIFIDGDKYELDMCQYCLKEKLGEHLRSVE